jgi:hypothetical protein
MKNHDVLAIAIAFVCGCAHSYAPPTPTYYSAGSFDPLDAIGYQTLRRGDFKASAPPGEGKGMPVAASAALVGAVTVAPGSEFAVIPVKWESDSTRFEAAAHHLHFHAVMDRNKSWWRSELDSVSTADVLEHEQIHFAIFELAARNLNARVPEIASRIRSTGRTMDDARRAANARLEAELQTSNEETTRRQSEFEHDTSNGMNRERQKEWWDKIQAELAASRSQ